MYGDWIMAYKGYGSDLTCRRFQYALGGHYAQNEKPILCRNGFHACLFPMDVYVYYPRRFYVPIGGPIPTKNVYSKVFIKLKDLSYNHGMLSVESKVCGKEIIIGDTLLSDNEMENEARALCMALCKKAENESLYEKYMSGRCASWWSEIINVLFERGYSGNDILDMIQKWQIETGRIDLIGGITDK